MINKVYILLVFIYLALGEEIKPPATQFNASEEVKADKVKPIEEIKIKEEVKIPDQIKIKDDIKIPDQIKLKQAAIPVPVKDSKLEPPKENVDIIKAFKESKVNPDVVATSPEKALEVFYESNKEVKLGNELTPKQVLKPPTVKFDADGGAFYTLIMTDPDAPSRSNPRAREWHHWLVVNIPGNDVSKGETLSAYVGSAPPKGSGLHRYVFLLFKQPEKLAFNESTHGPTDGNRAKFHTENFSKKYNLGAPVAGNFFQAQWDDTVPATHKKLGF